MNQAEFLKKIIQNSHLSDESKSLWLEIIPKLTDGEVEAIVELVKEDITQIDGLTQNLSKKLKDLEKQDDLEPEVGENVL